MPEIPDDELASLRSRAEAADSAAAAATQAAADADAARAALTAGITRYRDTLRAAHPTIPADAIDGASFDDVDASATRARAIAEAAIAAQPKPAATPAVSPAAGARTATTDTDGMSPFQKVSAGLAARAAR